MYRNYLGSGQGQCHEQKRQKYLDNNESTSYWSMNRGNNMIASLEQRIIIPLSRTSGNVHIRRLVPDSSCLLKMSININKGRRLFVKKILKKASI